MPLAAGAGCGTTGWCFRCFSRFAENRFVNQALHENRDEYQRLSGKPFPDTQYPKDAWRTDPAAFEKRIAENAIDWGGAWFDWAWNEMRPDLDIMRALSEERRFKLLIALFPATIQWEAEFLDDRPQQFFKALMNELEIEHLDLLPALRAAFQRDRQSLAYDHAHLRLEGNRLAAQAIATVLRSTGDHEVGPGR